MNSTRLAGSWRRWARMGRGRNVVEVSRYATAESLGPYVVSLNGNARRSFDSWSDALKYGAHVLQVQPGG